MKHQVSGSRGRRSLISALALGSLIALGFALPAAAATGPNIDPETTGTLTIHKYESPADDPGYDNNGTPLDPAPDLPGLVGVTFTVTPIIGIDLLTNDGWNQAAVWANDPSSIPAANLDVAGAFTLTTGAGGVVSSGVLSIGAYLIEETDPGAHDIVLPAAASRGVV